MPSYSRLEGQQSVYTATFVDDTGAAINPSTVTFLWRTSAGVETSYAFGTASEVTRTSTGVYEFTAPAYAASGAHTCRVRSTGPIAASELRVGVLGSKFTTP